MIHYLYRTGFLICCIGLPLQAASASNGHSSFQPHSKAPLSTKNSTCTSLAKSTASSEKQSTSSHVHDGGRLARLTAYWAGEGDYYTGHGLSSTGIHLHDGHCAVDPRIIPYGSEVEISGVGTYLAVDTGSAVISREAARETGHTSEERSALVIDLYFENRRDGQRFAASGPKFASISWHSPNSAKNALKKTSNLVASDN